MISDKKFIKMPDEVLMKNFIRHHDNDAFSYLYKRHFPPLCKYIGWISGDLEKGKDIAQSIFIKIYQNPASFDSSRKFNVWLFSIAKNQWKNELRNEAIRNKHQELLIFEIADETSADDDSANNTKKLKSLNTELEALSETHKEVFILKYSNNLTIKEISEVCDCSEGTVKSRLFYALKKLKDKLNPE